MSICLSFKDGLAVLTAFRINLLSGMVWAHQRFYMMPVFHQCPPFLLLHLLSLSLCQTAVSVLADKLALLSGQSANKTQIYVSLSFSLHLCLQPYLHSLSAGCKVCCCLCSWLKYQICTDACPRIVQSTMCT